MTLKSQIKQILRYMNRIRSQRDSLAQRSRGENFGNEVDILILGVNP